MWALDFSNDYLASVLNVTSEDKYWAAFDTGLNCRTLRVYELRMERIRTDSTTANRYWQVTEDCLFHIGHSKDYSQDLPQLKLIVADLDPLGMPLATQVVARNRADGHLYILAIDQMQAGLERCGKLVIGHINMLALATRAHLHAGQEYSLGLLSALKVPPEVFEGDLQAVWSGKHPMQSAERQHSEGQIEKIAEGYEIYKNKTNPINSQEVTWRECRLFIRSLLHAEAAETVLSKCLESAQKTLQALNRRRQGKKRLSDEPALCQPMAAILKRHQVKELLTVHLTKPIQQRPLRKYGNRAAKTRLERTLSLSVQPGTDATSQPIPLLGF